MLKFHDYDPSKPFPVKEERHYIEGGEVFLDYTPKAGTLQITSADGTEFKLVTGEPKEGEFFINYEEGSQYKLANQKVTFSEADNGKKISCDYEGVSTLIKAKHMNEIKDFMDMYRERRAINLIEGTEQPTSKEQVEMFSDSQIVERLDIPVKSIDGNVLGVSVFSGVEVGKEFTLADSENFETVKVTAISTKDRTITVDKVEKTYTDPHLYRTTTEQNGDKAETVSGMGGTVEWKPDIKWQGKEENKVAPVEIESFEQENVSLDGKNITVNEATNSLLAYNTNRMATPILYGEPIGVGRGSLTGRLFFGEKKENIFNCSSSISSVDNESDIPPERLIAQQILGITSSKKGVFIPKLYFCYRQTAVSSTQDYALFLSASPSKGFSVHPAFIKEDGSVLEGLMLPNHSDYKKVLFSEYDPSNNSDSLISYYQFDLCKIILGLFGVKTLALNEIYAVKGLIQDGQYFYFNPFVEGKYDKTKKVRIFGTTSFSFDKENSSAAGSYGDYSITLKNINMNLSVSGQDLIDSKGVMSVDGKIGKPSAAVNISLVEVEEVF